MKEGTRGETVFFRSGKSSNRERRKRKNERGDHNTVFVDVYHRDGER